MTGTQAQKMAGTVWGSVKRARPGAISVRAVRRRWKGRSPMRKPESAKMEGSS